MDYVRETLERQSALWRALLLGGEAPESGDTAPESAAGGGTEEEETRLSPAGTRAAAEAAAGTAAETESQSGSAALPQRKIKESEAEQAPLRERQERLRMETRLLRSAETAETDAPGGRRAQSGEAAAESVLWEAEVARLQGRGELEPADARAISRRFERDARRYDGGFIFY